MKDIFKIQTKKHKEQFIEFDRIAKLLLNRCIFQTPKESYLIREIEFYYSSGDHTDHYCHENPRQLTNSRLYFHRFNNPEKYKKLRRKGIDITIGDDSNVYGGILIRTLQNIKTKEVISGIGKITNEIIDEIGGAEIITTIYENDNSILDQNSILRLLETENNNLTIYKKQRIGLNRKESDSDGFYHSAKYNYFTYPEIEVLK